VWPNGISAAPVSSVEDVRRIAGEVWETWNITATQGAYGRYLRNLRPSPDLTPYEPKKGGTGHPSGLITDGAWRKMPCAATKAATRSSSSSASFSVDASTLRSGGNALHRDG
jgi:hypothetical protein